MGKISARPVGIDLGTTFSALAYLDDLGEPKAVPSAQGKKVTPSVVLINPDRSIVVGEEALGGEALWKDAGPIDNVTTTICLEASEQPPMTKAEWVASPWGLAPRIDKQFHLCRHFMIAVRKEWEDSKVVAARDAAIEREQARRAAEEAAKQKKAA